MNDVQFLITIFNPVAGDKVLYTTVRNREVVTITSYKTKMCIQRFHMRHWPT